MKNALANPYIHTQKLTHDVFLPAKPKAYLRAPVAVCRFCAQFGRKSALKQVDSRRLLPEKSPAKSPIVNGSAPLPPASANQKLTSARLCAHVFCQKRRNFAGLKPQGPEEPVHFQEHFLCHPSELRPRPKVCKTRSESVKRRQKVSVK